ncbi:DUF4376 domain-containing protein [Rhizobium sp. LjRoot98]|uniref:DUF4376 domain-containing protein n=1 Tax=Rhizobium sp. LjRoot98 TaxID=3342345 RepID=UPI003ECFE660
MKYALFDEVGLPTAFYSEDVHGNQMRPVYQPGEPIDGEPVYVGDNEDGTPIYGPPALIGYSDPVQIGEEPNPDCKIPADAIAITDEQWMEFLTNQGFRRWDGSDVVAYEAPAAAATSDDVNAERQRRITAGRVISSVRVTGRADDARNLMSLALIAQMRIAAADTTTPTTYRDGDNVDHTLTPPQIVSMWQGSAAYVSALYQASWDIKAMEPIPADFSADQYWP